MLLSVVPLGNSRGIRIPSPILEQCNIHDQIKLEVEAGRIILEPVHEAPRKGWEEAFRAMSTNNEDNLLIFDDVDIDMEDWNGDFSIRRILGQP